MACGETMKEKWRMVEVWRKIQQRGKKGKEKMTEEGWKTREKERERGGRGEKTRYKE